MQCVVVKSGTRCTNQSESFPYGLSVPLVKPEAVAWLCGDCIYDMYTAMTAGDFPTGAKPLTPEQIKKEFR